MNKLVRDKIPDIIRSEGKVPRTREVSGDVFHWYLLKKLEEEMLEFLQDPSLEELADVEEVIWTIMVAHGWTRGELDEARSKKNTERGTFANRIVLESIETNDETLAVPQV